MIIITAVFVDDKRNNYHYSSTQFLIFFALLPHLLHIYMYIVFCNKVSDNYCTNVDRFIHVFFYIRILRRVMVFFHDAWIFSTRGDEVILKMWIMFLFAHQKIRIHICTGAALKLFNDQKITFQGKCRSLVPPSPCYICFIIYS